MIKVYGVSEGYLKPLVEDTPWRVRTVEGVCVLECYLYDDSGGYQREFWWDPEDAQEYLAKFAHRLPSGASIQGSCNFEAFGNTEADHPEDLFGVIAIEDNEVVLRYGVRIYDPNVLTEGLCHSNNF